jgi:HEAT repeat protein
VVAAQAAAELARRGDPAALRKLQVLLDSHDAVVRRVAASALGGQLGHARDVGNALLDPDPGVRLAAASAILAA